MLWLTLQKLSKFTKQQLLNNPITNVKLVTNVKETKHIIIAGFDVCALVGADHQQQAW